MGSAPERFHNVESLLPIAAIGEMSVAKRPPSLYSTSGEIDSPGEIKNEDVENKKKFKTLVDRETRKTDTHSRSGPLYSETL